MIKDSTLLGQIVHDVFFDAVDDHDTLAMLFRAYAGAAAEHSSYWEAYHSQRAWMHECAALGLMNEWMRSAYSLDAPLP